MKPIVGVGSRGIAAGIVGATALALWFLVLDGLNGSPFRTPGFIAHALLGVEQVEPSPGPVVLYTLLHYAAWIVVGVLVAWVRTKVKTAAPLLLGLVLGFLLFELVFYTSVLVTGVDIVAELGWATVLPGNLFAGMSTLWFLHLVGPTRPIPWLASLADNQIIHEGVVAGSLGAAVVAFWFLLFDLGRGTPLYTPGALGSSLFIGAQSPEQIQITATTVLGYTVLHIAGFIAAGLLVAALVAAVDRMPPFVFGAILLFVVFEAFFIGALAVVAEFLLGTLAWWTVAVGNFLAAAVMGGYLWARHPALRKALASNAFEVADQEPREQSISA